MKKLIVLVIICGIIIKTNLIAQNNTFNANNYNFIGFTPSLITPYHTAEGVLLQLGGDTLLNIFRIDSTNQHLSNSGALVKRFSFNGGKTFTDYSNFYNTQFDDRNVIGTVTDKGRIIIVFRKLDINNPNLNMIGSIYSDDKGKTWSNYIKLPTILPQPIGSIIKGGDGAYYASIIGKDRAQILRTTNSEDWALISMVTKTGLDESALCYVGNNRMILLSRDENILNQDSSYYMHRSGDNGKTWEYVGRTQMNGNQISANRTPPFLYQDKIRNQIIAISYTRHGPKPTLDNLYIYIQNPDDAFNNKWNFREILHRPMENNTLPFYGYFTICSKTDGNMIGITTDDFKPNSGNGKQAAVLFQFQINYIK